MVRVNKDVMCLGFVEGGFNTKVSILIGWNQVEENLLEFDIAAFKLGFSSLLHSKQACASSNLLEKHNFLLFPSPCKWTFLIVL